MFVHRAFSPMLAILLSAPVLAWANSAEEPALGSRDFYPSAARPVGYRGDGNGAFPGATPVITFWEGTPRRVEMEYRDKWGREKTEETWDFADDKPHNIAWKTRMPAWANSQPIVVGDRVFTYAEPHTLVCVDANSGKILWQRGNAIWNVAGLPGEGVAARLERMADVYRVCHNFMRHINVNKPSPAEAEPLCETFSAAVLPRLVAALKQVDPETDYSNAAAQVRQALDDYRKAKKDPKSKKGKKVSEKQFMALASQVKDRIEAISGLKVNLAPPWGNMIGRCMTAPVSDGRHVYASFSPGQIACYDLNGNRKWARYIEPDGNRTPVQSPLLVGDVLVDMHGGTTVLRGLNKHTGETLWEAPTRNAKAKGRKGGYYVGGHKIVRLRNGDAEMDVIVTSLCNIIRPTDGRELGHLPWPDDRYGPSGGHSIFNAGNLVYKSTCGDGGGSPFVCYELKLVDRDTVTATERYAVDRSPGYQGQIAIDGVLLTTRNSGTVMDAASGEVLVKGSRRRKLFELSTILAGNYVFHIDDNSRDQLMDTWLGRTRPDGWTMELISVTDVSNPKAPKPIDSRNVLGVKAAPPIPWMQRLAPELYDDDTYWGSWCAKPAHFMHIDTGMFASGNRLFIRSVSHLYCIGDPDVKYDWNPKSRPADITAALR